jgi:hypothetical protein
MQTVAPNRGAEGGHFHSTVFILHRSKGVTVAEEEKIAAGGTVAAHLSDSPAVSANSAASDDDWGGGDKGLKGNALGLISSVVIGVSSTAPAYSLAVTLGLITAVVGIGFRSPAIMIISFIPMILIAGSYYYLNKVDPDCGTTFS